VLRQVVVLTVSVTLSFVLIGAPAVANTTVTVDFEDDIAVGANITCNPDLGLPFECEPVHHEWLRAQGIDIVGSANGFVYTTLISGIARTGVIVGFVAPDYGDPDGGINIQKSLTIRFLNTRVGSASLVLVTSPSDAPEYVDIPTTVVADALDATGTVIGSATTTFIGVSNGVFTPGGVSVSASGIAALQLSVTAGPPGGVFLESVTTDRPLAVLASKGVVTAVASADAPVNFSATANAAPFVGRLQFDDRVANIRVDGGRLDYIVFWADCATFDGAAMVNGEAGYRFRFVGCDRSPAGAQDVFLLRVFGNDFVYQNSNAEQAIGGVITVHISR
jgi:hypothetical protein